MTVVNNSDVNYSLYYSVLDYFKTIMSNHPSINYVSQGDVFSIDTKEFPQYPMGNIMITDATFDGSTTLYSCQLVVADKQKLKNNQSTGSFNELQAGAIHSAYHDNPDDYIDNLLDDTYFPPGNHDPKTISAIRRRLNWLEYSDIFQSNASSKLPSIIKKLEKGGIIIFNVSLLRDLEQFLFNSVLARTLFDIRKTLKSSTDYSTFETKLGKALPQNFFDNYKANLKKLYISSGTNVKDPYDMPIIIFTIEEAPSILRPEIMKFSNVFKDISRQGRKFNLGLEVISQQYTPIDDTIISNMNTVVNLPLRSEKEKSAASKILGGGIQYSDIESLTGTRGIALISGIWLTNFQKLRIPLYDDYFKEVSKNFYIEFSKKMKSQTSTPPTGLP